MRDPLDTTNLGGRPPEASGGGAQSAGARTEALTWTPQVFLLSPAHCAGRRATMFLRPGSDFPLARQLETGTLSLGVAFSFLSGLYFRGKLDYARTFGRATDATDETALVITPSRGLPSPQSRITANILREFASADVTLENPRYRIALERDVTTLGRRLSRETLVVLLGSVATGKYVDVLGPILGGRLRYPRAFIGRGDMSRGGLLLRSVRSGTELEYAVLQSGVRSRGPRPPKLEPRGL